MVWCYAMCGTDLGYGATRLRAYQHTRATTRQGGDNTGLGGAIRLRASYAMSGTDLAAVCSSAMCAVLTQGMLLRDVCGTDLAYAATRCVRY
eukprot:1107986-Rhodomonas_salina.1